MQLSIHPVTKRAPNGRLCQRFDVVCDGVTVHNAMTRSLALAHMDALWESRPESDRVLEQLYTGD